MDTKNGNTVHVKDEGASTSIWLWALGLGLSLGLALIFLLWWGTVAYLIGEEMGPWGDSFGPVSSLLNTLVLFVALLSMEMQRRALRMTSKELTATLDEMRDQRIAQQQQAETQAASLRLARLQMAIDAFNLQIRLRSEIVGYQGKGGSDRTELEAMQSPVSALRAEADRIVDELSAEKGQSKRPSA